MQESLAHNSLQTTLWFQLGYASLQHEEWSVAATAYRRCCVLDPEVRLKKITSFECFSCISIFYLFIICIYFDFFSYIRTLKLGIIYPKLM